jgi:cell division protein FtsQ
VVKKRKKQVRRTRSKAKAANRFDFPVMRAALKPVGILAVLLLVSIAGRLGYQWLMLPSTLPVQYVELRGDLSRVDMDRLREQVNAAVTGGFFSADLEGVRRDLESLPWVYGASLRRIFPDRIIVEIEEHKPIAQWGESGLLNQYGEVFEAELAKADYPLARLSGEEGREKQLISDFVEANGLLDPLDLHLAGLREDARRDQRLFLDSGIELALGRKDRQARLGRFVAAYPQTLAPFMLRISMLDLRYTNGFAVRWKQDKSAPELTKTKDDRV